MARINLRSVAPMAYQPVLAMEAYARSTLDHGTAELIKLRASALNGCGYCTAMHTREATKAGETDARIAAVGGDWEASGLFDDKESAALRFTDALTQPDGELPEALHLEVVEQWGEKGLAHLVMAISTINVWNRIAIGTGMTADDL